MSINSEAVTDDQVYRNSEVERPSEQDLRKTKYHGELWTCRWNVRLE